MRGGGPLTVPGAETGHEEAAGGFRPFAALLDRFLSDGTSKLAMPPGAGFPIPPACDPIICPRVVQ